MKRFPTFWLAGLSALLVMAAASHAAELGMQAPELQIAEWVEGTPISLAAIKGKGVAVIEFWATWCGPCRRSIPHLTEMQQKFRDKGVTFVGVTDEELPVVKKFVTQMGDKMNYTVAIDRDGKTSQGYMKAFGVDGIPHAFVVDKAGQIVWQGHPMGELEETLTQVVAGKWNVAAARQHDRAHQLLEEFVDLAGTGQSGSKLDAIARELETLDKKLGGIHGKHFDAAETKRTARFEHLSGEYQQAVGAGKTDVAEKLEPQIVAVAPKDFNLPEFKQTTAGQALFAEYANALMKPNNEAKIAELTQKLAATPAKNAEFLNEMAWVILTNERFPRHDAVLGLKLAQAAYDACDGKNPSIVDTYARALWDNGRKAEAIRYQKKAVELAPDADFKARLGETLKKYESAD